MPKYICKETQCTGCSACVNICPKHCIGMKPKAVGHLYPQIDKTKCVECGACIKVCPSNRPIPLRQPLTAFAGWHKSLSEYETSTSGGAATAFAQSILSDGGFVYGSTCLENVDIRHIRITHVEDLVKLKGSKYAQSTMGDIFKSVKADLEVGLKVLFIGTPCQIAGLKSFLHGHPDNLYLVDLICHGVPSVKLLREHVKNVLGHQKVTNISFRSDPYLLLLLLFCGDKILYKSNLVKERFKDAYYNAFIDGYSYRDSCYRCPYAQSKRVSDITIGDFWGLSQDFKEPHEHGCSCILPITDKGKQLVKNANLNIFERPLNEAVRGNEQLQAPKHKNIIVKIFRMLYPCLGLKYSYALALPFELCFQYRCRLMIGTRLKRLFRKT